MKTRPAVLFAVLTINLSLGIAGQIPRRAARPKRPASGAGPSLKSEITSAIGSFTEAIRFDPKHADPYLLHTAAYGNKGDYDKAITDYGAGLTLDGKYSVAWLGRGSAYTQRGEHKKAIADYSQAIELDPKYECAALYARL